MIVNLPIKSDNNTTRFKTNTFPLVKTLLIGSSIASSDDWTPITKDLEIKGGGLLFTKEGISLLPGTQTRKP